MTLKGAVLLDHISCVWTITETLNISYSCIDESSPGPVVRIDMRTRRRVYNLVVTSLIVILFSLHIRVIASFSLLLFPPSCVVNSFSLCYCFFCFFLLFQISLSLFIIIPPPRRRCTRLVPEYQRRCRSRGGKANSGGVHRVDG